MLPRHTPCVRRLFTEVEHKARHATLRLNTKHAIRHSTYVRPAWFSGAEHKARHATLNTKHVIRHSTYVRPVWVPFEELPLGRCCRCTAYRRPYYIIISKRVYICAWENEENNVRIKLPHDHGQYTVFGANALHETPVRWATKRANPPLSSHSNLNRYESNWMDKQFVIFKHNFTSSIAIYLQTQCVWPRKSERWHVLRQLARQKMHFFCLPKEVLFRCRTLRFMPSFYDGDQCSGSMLQIVGQILGQVRMLARDSKESCQVWLQI